MGGVRSVFTEEGNESSSSPGFLPPGSLAASSPGSGHVSLWKRLGLQTSVEMIPHQLCSVDMVPRCRGAPFLLYRKLRECIGEARLRGLG